MPQTLVVRNCAQQEKGYYIQYKNVDEQCIDDALLVRRDILPNAIGTDPEKWRHQ